MTNSFLCANFSFRMVVTALRQRVMLPYSRSFLHSERLFSCSSMNSAQQEAGGIFTICLSPASLAKSKGTSIPPSGASQQCRMNFLQRKDI